MKDTSKSVKIRPLTTTGIVVKKALIDAGLTQQEFCLLHSIDKSMLSRIIHEDQIYFELRKHVLELLNLNVET